MSCSKQRNPLSHGGTSQTQRLLPAMQKNYVLVDEKDFGDWIVFASRFGAYINYYDQENKISGDWQQFFSTDISAVAGTIAVQNVSSYAQAIKENFIILKSNRTIITEKQEALSAVVSAAFTIAKQVDYYFKTIERDNDFYEKIKVLVKTGFKAPFEKMIRYYKGAMQRNLITEKDFENWSVLNEPVKKPRKVLQNDFSNLWYEGGGSWTAYLDAVNPDVGIYGPEGSEPGEQIMHAANHNFFSSLFDQFLRKYLQLVAEAEKMLLSTLEKWPAHLPHYALFLSFLKLYKIAQSDINNFTNRHLDYYYKDVLKMTKRKAQPNSAHLVFTLNKTIDQYLLKAGTKFKAGKDGAGIEAYYENVKDVLLNKGVVTELKALYLGTANDNIDKIENANRIFAAPVVNSADGLGAGLNSLNKEWHPFVNKAFLNGTQAAVNMPKAEIGFAIASHYLFLAEGTRTVEIKFVRANGSVKFPNALSLKCFLTTEKAWLPVTNLSWQVGKTNGTPPDDAAVLKFEILSTDPAITAYNKNIHGENFLAEVPVLKCILVNEDDKPYQYELLKDVSISKIGIAVNVTGVKQLQVAGDTGLLDPSQAFLPFGPLPQKGSYFILGSKEIFSKKNSTININFTWKGLPLSANNIKYSGAPDYYPATPQVSLAFLQGSQWVADDSNTAVDIFEGVQPDVSIPDSAAVVPTAALVPWNKEFLPFSVSASGGFLKLTLNDDFGHKNYQNGLMAEMAKGQNAIPANHVEPYTPNISALSADYYAQTVNSISKEANDVQFYQIHPFGSRLCNTSTSVLPSFQHWEENRKLQHEGEFYIGLNQLLPGDSIDILFQILEGSTNPLLDKPDEHIVWSYLTYEGWKIFKKEDVVDTTLQLIQSGIISFKIPPDAAINNTMFSADAIWICASVNEAAEAVAKIIDVKAQAAKVTFVDNQNDPAFMSQVLEAGRIAKLQEAVNDVKKVEQPFASFGGRGAEDDEGFYKRVSERLRHKGRAITIWDYEHLILEAFPSIYKVKCLNHTQYEGGEYDEIAPGNITIITIPSLTNRHDNNPLRPYTSQDLLAQIEKFLAQRVSTHVKLHVQHPRFEEVRVQFDLKLTDGLSFNYYSGLLKQEITQFLTPWAFDAGHEISFGGRIEKSSVINFIEERPYVQHVANVKMFHRPDETRAEESDDLDFIVASEARSILVSTQPSRHVIGELFEDAFAVTNETCIDRDNLIVVPPKPPVIKRPGSIFPDVIKPSNDKGEKLISKSELYKNPFLKRNFK